MGFICQARTLEEKKANIQTRSDDLANRKAKLAAGTAAADAKDEEPRCLGHSQQR